MAKLAPCGKCEKDVIYGDKAMLCEGLCEHWYHVDCVKMPEARYQELQIDVETKWRCPTCDSEPFLTICGDIKYLQSVIFSISSKAPLSTLENISSEVKAFVNDITVKNENVLEDELSNNNMGETPFNDEEYQYNMNTYEKIGYICEKRKKSTRGSAENQSLEKYQPSMDPQRKKPSGKLLQPYSIIMSAVPDVFDEDDVCCKKSHSCVPSNSELIMENPEEIKETGVTLSAETSASKTDIPNSDQQQAIAEENADEDHQQVTPQSAEVENVPTSKSKSATGDQVGAGTGEYEVEDILDHMKVHDKTIFLVKWKNYGHESNSWESREDLTNCKLAISKYFRRSMINYENALKEQREGGSIKGDNVMER